MGSQASRRRFFVGLCAGLALLTAATNAVSAPLPPRAAVTRRLEKWRCTNQDCEPYIYDPALGAESIKDEANPSPPGVAFEELPEDWICPVCGDPKRLFLPLGEWVEVTLAV